MTSRLADLAVSTTFAGTLLLANTSCATRHPDDAATLAARPEVQAHGAQRLVQFSFGTQAEFGICVEPACPAVTPKTLSMAGTAPMQVVGHRVVPSGDIPPQPGTVKEVAPMPSLPPAAPPVPVDVAMRNVVVVFPFASAQLTVPARAALSASIRHARQSERIVISGRTDAVGNDQVNESLALARAMSVRNYLRDQVPALTAAISIDARGRCCFVAPNETEDGRSRNRRVEIAFFSQGGG
ncbi:MAG: OmpA family protein [Burkholderiaceae bacterium]|nr:OmpA family protein [Burkholderiaceae bacterium]